MPKFKETKCKSLLKTEKMMKSRRIISAGYEDLLAGKRNPKNVRISVLYVVYHGIIILRSVLLCFFYFQGNEFGIRLLGDFFLSLGTLGKVCYFWMITFSILMIQLRLVMLQCESKGKLYYLTDLMFLMKELKLSETGLNGARYKKFRLHAYGAHFFADYLFWPLFAASYFTCWTGFYLTFFHGKPFNQTYCLISIAWLVFVITWFRECQRGYFIFLATYHFPITYIRLRFNQFNESIEKFRDALLRERDETSINENDDKLKAHLDEHLKIVNQVARANIFMRWMILQFVVFFPTFIAVSTYPIIYSSFPNVFLHFAIADITFNVFCFTSFFSFAAILVELEAKKSFVSLNSIFSRASNKFSLPVRKKLLLTIQRMACKSHPIAFYCLNWYPYTAVSFFTLCASSITTFILVVGIM